MLYIDTILKGVTGLTAQSAVLKNMSSLEYSHRGRGLDDTHLVTPLTMAELVRSYNHWTVLMGSTYLVQYLRAWDTCRFMLTPEKFGPGNPPEGVHKC